MELILLYQIVKEPQKEGKNVIDGLNCYVKQINIKRYKYYIITYHFLVMTIILQYQVIWELPMK